MTLLAFVLWAFTSSSAITDSERMMAQLESPTLALASAPQTVAPICPTGGLCNE